MAEQSGGEKSLPASPLKRQRAREDGKVAKSQDLASAVAMLVALAALYFIGPLMFSRMTGALYYFFSEAANLLHESPDMQQLTILTFWTFGPVLLLFVAVMMFGGLLVNVLQVGFLFTSKPLTPKLEKLNPITGFAKFFDLRTFVELVKSVLKVALIVWVVWLSMRNRVNDYVVLMDMTPEGLVSAVGELIFVVWWRVMLVMLVLGILDYGFQRWQFERDLMMTQHEARQELKEFEGDPKIKQRVRQIQRQMAMQRMMRDIPKADVIITNPIRFAVALQYDPANMAAPIVIGKGARLLAERIREIAREKAIPIVEKPELARALYKTIEVGQPVPENLFRAVAEVLAYVYQIDRRTEKIRERERAWDTVPQAG